jgi:PKD repeat protein
MSITTGIAPLTVSFTDTSTGDGLKYTWAFGDGGTSTQPNPTHIYEEPNNYEVTLFVENDNGDDKASHTVIVKPTSNNGNGDDGGGYKGYPSYEAWLAAQKGGGSQGPPRGPFK